MGKKKRNRATAVRPEDSLPELTTSVEWTGPWATIPDPDPTPEEIVQKKLAPHERDLEAVLDYRKAVKLFDELDAKGWSRTRVMHFNLQAAFANQIIDLTPADEPAANEAPGNS